MLDKIVFGLLFFAVVVSATLFIYSAVEPSYALIHVSAAGDITPSAPLFSQRNCDEYIKTMDSFGPIDGKYACVQTSKLAQK